MSSTRQSDIFKKHFAFWKVFGLWSRRKPNKYYKYYSSVYLLITLVLYNILLTLNLVYTPRKMENLIREVIFYFTEITVTSKVLMIIIMQDKILEAFNLMDGKDLEGNDDVAKKIIQKSNADLATFLKFFATISHISFSSQVFIPIILHLIFHTGLELPVCKYYFLTDELRDKYFIYWFIYQSWGMYGHMLYNITIDTFIAGLLVTAVIQFRILNAKFNNLKLMNQEYKMSFAVQEKVQMLRLRECLTRYDVLLKYCNVVQDIINVTIFVEFGISSLIICVVLCGLLLPSSTEAYIFMVLYLFAMTLQIFVPGYLGTLINYESAELAHAAYCTEWIPRSESFKRSIRVFIERANKPIQMTGLKMLPLSLTTFTSIVKSAYSFFALIRSFQE